LRKRLPTQEKMAVNPTEQFVNKKRRKEDEHPCRLQCLEIDLESPLSDIEWRNFADVINEVAGLGWFQVLPVGQKSS